MIVGPLAYIVSNDDDDDDGNDNNDVVQHVRLHGGTDHSSAIK